MFFLCVECNKLTECRPCSKSVNFYNKSLENMNVLISKAVLCECGERRKYFPPLHSQLSKIKFTFSHYQCRGEELISRYGFNNWEVLRQSVPGRRSFVRSSVDTTIIKSIDQEQNCPVVSCPITRQLPGIWFMSLKYHGDCIIILIVSIFLCAQQFNPIY